MDRRWFKSLALGLLVALSLVLTVQLWYGEPAGLLQEPLEPPEEPEQLPAAPEPETGPVMPLLAARSLGEGEWQGFGPDHELLREAWQAVAAELAGPDPWPFLEAQSPPVQDLELGREGTWLFDLPLSLNLRDWAVLLGGPRQPVVEGPRVRQVVVDPQGRLFWHDGDGNFYPQEGEVSLPAPEPDRGRALVPGADAAGDDVPVAPGVLVPAQAPQLGTWRGRLASADPEEQARLFFADMSLVREIRERDDAVIYTDGQRALRVYPTGQVEYSFPELEPSLEAPGVAAAWDRARTFVEQHGGWPVDTVLWSAEANREDVEFTLQLQHQGLPLLGPQPALHFTVGGSGVSFLQRHRLTGLSQQDAAREVAPAEAVLQEWLPQAVGGEEQPQVAALRLAYLGEARGAQEREFAPVWWVQADDGQEWLFCAFSGVPREVPAPEYGPGEGEAP